MREKQTLGDAPIEGAVRDKMRDIAGILDQVMNPEGKKNWGFILMMFPFVDHEGRCNYISNARREDVVTMLKEQLARFEGQPEMKGNA